MTPGTRLGPYEIAAKIGEGGMGKPISSPGRVTFVIARRGAEWKIVHFHRSGVPGRPN